MVKNFFKISCLLIGTALLYIYVLCRDVNMWELGVFGIFLICVVAFYPYTIEKRILKIKRKKFVKNMIFKSGSYVFEDELSEINHSMQKLNCSQRKKKVIFGIIIFSLLIIMAIFLIGYYYWLKSQNLPIRVFLNKYVTVFSYIMALILIITVGIITEALYKRNII